MSLYGELEAAILREVDRLPARCREVFLLSRRDGLSNREIAERLGISDPAVHKSIERALHILSQKLEI